MQQVLLIYTGGTIGMVKDADTGVLCPFNFDNLLEQIPQLKTVEAKIDTLSIPDPKDSADMHPEDWQFLGQLIFDKYDDYDGFVVLHGTDTMAYTSSALSFMFKNLTKPIIFTGSQLPVGDIRTDALENVLTAIQIALLTKNGKPIITEVGLFFDSRLLRANRSLKVSTNQFNAFDSPNYPALITSGVSLDINYMALLKSDFEKRTTFDLRLDSSVFVLKLHPGITKKMFESLCVGVDFKILIIESYGSGTVFIAKWFLDLVLKLKEHKKIVINCSQCVQGGVGEGIYESSKVLKDAEVLSSRDMTTESALTKSMILLAKNDGILAFNDAFVTSFSGEIL